MPERMPEEMSEGMREDMSEECQKECWQICRQIERRSQAPCAQAPGDPRSHRYICSARERSLLTRPRPSSPDFSAKNVSIWEKYVI